MPSNPPSFSNSRTRRFIYQETIQPKTLDADLNASLTAARAVPPVCDFAFNVLSNVNAS